MLANLLSSLSSGSPSIHAGQDNNVGVAEACLFSEHEAGQDNNFRVTRAYPERIKLPKSFKTLP